MDVGAVFIATLTLAIENIVAIHPHVEHRPPETHRELLTASIRPVVAFIVLVSVAVHECAVQKSITLPALGTLFLGLSIPFFSLGKRMHRSR